MEKYYICNRVNEFQFEMIKNDENFALSVWSFDYSKKLNAPLYFSQVAKFRLKNALKHFFYNQCICQQLIYYQRYTKVDKKLESLECAWPKVKKALSWLLVLFVQEILFDRNALSK